MSKTRKAFTLVELVMVIVIIGLLAAVVVPKFGDLKDEAQTAAEQGTVAGVRTGIKLVHMTNLAQGSDTYPATLDSAAVGAGSETNPLFTNVIDGGISDGNWEKNDADTYEYTPTGNTYDYDSSDGSFTLN
jgi:prepilin-type N-terminal cleavage/methylation domain-containing protein